MSYMYNWRPQKRKKRRIRGRFDYQAHQMHAAKCQLAVISMWQDVATENKLAKAKYGRPGGAAQSSSQTTPVPVIQAPKPPPFQSSQEGNGHSAHAPVLRAPTLPTTSTTGLRRKGRGPDKTPRKRRSANKLAA